MIDLDFMPKRDDSPIIRAHKSFKVWRYLGWIPYCPKEIRKQFPWLKSPFIPYNLVVYKRTKKLKLWYGKYE